MSWDVKRRGKRWGERKLVKKDSFRGGIKVHDVCILDEDGSPTSTIERTELQSFLDFCICCGQNIVDTRKGGGCSIRNDCCSVCWKECQRLQVCQLK